MANSHPFQTLPRWRITATISHNFARVKRYLYDYTARNATKNRNKKYPKNSDIFVTETLQKSNLHRKPTTHQNHQKHNVVSHTKNLNAPIEWNAYSSSKTYHRQAGIFWLHQNSSRIKWKKIAKLHSCEKLQVHALILIRFTFCCGSSACCSTTSIISLATYRPESQPINWWKVETRW